MFRDSDLVFITPDAVLAIIEVKSKVDKAKFRESIAKLSEIGRTIGNQSQKCILSLFSFEITNNPRNWYKEILPNPFLSDSEIIQLISLGCSSFVKGWEINPINGDSDYNKWHSYELDNMSAGYFITNLIDAVTSDSGPLDQRLWFPRSSKELKLLDVIDYRSIPDREDHD